MEILILVLIFAIIFNIIYAIPKELNSQVEKQSLMMKDLNFKLMKLKK